MISIYDIEGVERLRQRNAIQPHRIRQFRSAWFKHALGEAEALQVLPAEARADFKKNITFHALEQVERHDSDADGASKLVFKTADHHLIESVILRPKTGRTSLCISSQVGCACYCSFCATGMMGFTRNLTRDEILDQVAQASRLVKAEGRSIRNVVFMGMGEPLLNLEHLFGALELLRSALFFNYSGAKLMVSTVGIPQAMARFSERFPDVQLALSLHSAQQQTREKLMPQARKYSLDLLRESLEQASRYGTVMIEYLMLAGVNDRPEDVRALGVYLQGLKVHINLIPFNEYAGCNLHGTPPAARREFSDQLKALGFPTTLRYSLGSDISAACGQLVRHKKSLNL